MAAEAFRLHAESTDLQKLFYDLKAAEGNLQVELRRGVREAAAGAVNAVKAESAWSTRIPDAVKATPFFTAKRAGVTIQADAKKAPEARPLEHGGQPGTFKHPVYGVWRTKCPPQAARPFFYKSLERSVDVEIAMRAVMARVAAKAGFR